MTIEQVMEPTTVPLPLHLVEELNHRVINEFTEAISMLSLAGRSSAPDARAAIVEAAARLGAHAEAHRALAPPGQGGSINLGNYICKLCKAISGSWLGDGRVQLTVRTEDIWLTAEKSWRVGLIVAELVRNADRHGLAGRPGAITVGIAGRSGVITCLVADSGRGKQGSTSGRGSRLIRSIAAELGGTVDWYFSPQGSLALMQIPIHKVGQN